MQIIVNGLTIESEDPTLVIKAAICSFGDPSSLEIVRSWALSYLNTWRGKSRLTLGLTSAEFQELRATSDIPRLSRCRLAPETDFGMAKEALARSLTNVQMAELVLAQHQAWLSASDTIEATYITALKCISNAISIEEVVEALTL